MTDFVKAENAGDGFVTFIMSMGTGDSGRIINTREADENKPELVISNYENDSSTGPVIPAVAITSPSNNSAFEVGTNINLSGSGIDNQDGDISATGSWASDLDGPLGTGSSINISSLSLGQHTITYSVTDTDGNTASDMITLTVMSPPDTESPTTPQNLVVSGLTQSSLNLRMQSDDSDNVVRDQV